MAIWEIESSGDTSKVDELIESCKQFWKEIEPKINIQKNVPKSKDRNSKDAFDWFFEILGEFSKEN
ncbi:hypothetical protein MYX07_05265 [Patescibacteria group bacterium AH-259-L07]|nr:hypothetical protein [Patescibacteria group bacterium AH-259-L07]